MVIFIIQVEDFSLGLVDPERDPPVAGDGEAPCSLAIAGELMRFPARDVAEFTGVCHLLQEGHNVPDPFHDKRRQAGWIVACDEAPQSPVDHVSDLHDPAYPRDSSRVKRRFTGTPASVARCTASAAATAFSDGLREGLS